MRLSRKDNSPIASAYTGGGEEKINRSSSHSSETFENTIETLESIQMEKKFSKSRHITHHVVLLLIMFLITILVKSLFFS